MIVVVRHAKAGDRETWAGDDRVRPLTGKGKRQAQGLVEVLAPFHFTRLLSSPYVRCRQTLEPLAADRGLTLEDAPALAEGGSLERLLRDAAAAGPDVAWAACTHGDVLGELLDGLVSRGAISADQAALAKGGSWVLELGPGGVVAARYLDPPQG